MEAKMYTQNIATVNGRNIGHYLVDTMVGQINVIQYEKTDAELETILIYGNYDKAEKKFKRVCNDILNGRR